MLGDHVTTKVLNTLHPFAADWAFVRKLPAM